MNDIIPKKRGRKSKKELEEIKLKAMNTNLESNTIESNTNLEPDADVEPEPHADADADAEPNTIINPEKPLLKKRGRKPKGGKIIQNSIPSNILKEQKPNIILHLKCFIKDIEESFKSTLYGYTFSNTNTTCDDNTANNTYLNLTEYKEKPTTVAIEFDENVDTNQEKHIWKKIKSLEMNLHKNNINKKSACFWDSCEFDNPPIYIPKNCVNDSYQVYGCFCSPECALSYLMHENIDSSVKFERYHLLNHMYSKIFKYTKNIKPSPDPFYMLDKYYGNLTIQEYRSLLRNDRLFLVIDKPLTHIFPELHEDNDDFIINNKIIPINNEISKKSSTKNNILTSKFGIGI